MFLSVLTQEFMSYRPVWSFKAAYGNVGQASSTLAFKHVLICADFECFCSLRK